MSIRQHLGAVSVQASAKGLLRSLMVYALFSFQLGCTSQGQSQNQTSKVAQAKDSTVNLNEISVLLPVRDETTGRILRDSLLGFDDFDFAPLLGTMADLVTGFTETLYSNMRLVSFRLDDCFPGRHGTNACIPQLRLVFEAVSEIHTADSSYFFITDSASHLVFNLSRSQFDTLLFRWLRLQRNEDISTDGDLRVHPILEQQGLESQFAQDMHQLLRQYANLKTFAEVATTLLLTSLDPQDECESNAHGARDWVFQLLTVQDEVLVNQPVPGTTPPAPLPTNYQHRQLFRGEVEAFSLPGDTHTAMGGMSCPPETGLSIMDQLDDGKRVSITSQNDTALEYLSRSVQIENPLETNPDIGCASCHVASPLKFDIENILGESAANKKHVLPWYINKGRNISAGRFTLSDARMFGYNANNSPVVTDRVHNESAEVADRLEQDLGGIEQNYYCDYQCDREKDPRYCRLVYQCPDTRDDFIE